MIPVKGQAFDLYVVCESIATPGTFYDHASAPTVLASPAGGAWSASGLTVTLPRGASTALVKIQLDGNAMNQEQVMVKVEDGTGTLWRDVMVVLNTDAALNPTQLEIALDVWNQDLTGLQTANSASKILQDIGTQAEIVDAIWTEDLTAHDGVIDSGAWLLNYIEGRVALIAEEVWDALLTSHNTVGTFGEAINEAGAGGGLTSTQVAQAVWNALLSNYTLGGSMGEAMNAGAGGITPSQVADAVWNEVMESHVTVGSAADMLRLRGHEPWPGGEIYWPDVAAINTGTLNLNDAFSLQFRNEPVGVLPVTNWAIIDSNHIVDPTLTGWYAAASVWIPSPGTGTMQLQAYNNNTTFHEDILGGRTFEAGHGYQVLASWALTADHIDVDDQVKLRLTGSDITATEIYVDWMVVAAIPAGSTDAGAIAQALWSEALPGPYQAGEAGHLLHEIYLTCQTIDTSSIALNATIEDVPMELIQAATNKVVLAKVPYPSNYEAIIFTAKYDESTPDDMAIIQVAYFPGDANKSGLIVAGGMDAQDPSWAYLTPDVAAKELTIYISSMAAMSMLTGTDYYWDVKALLSPLDAWVLARSNQLDIVPTTTFRTS